jgi:hypothetical protein
MKKFYLIKNSLRSLRLRGEKNLWSLGLSIYI